VTVAWLDGTKLYLKGGHVAYAIPVAIILALFLLPMVIYVKKLCRKKRNNENSVSESITSEDKKESVRYSWNHTKSTWVMPLEAHTKIIVKFSQVCIFYIA